MISYTLNEIGDSVALLALSYIVYAQTNSAVATTGLFVVSRFVPALLAPLVAARIDQLPVRMTLPALYIFEAALFGGLAVSVHGVFSLALILVLTCLDATIALTARALSRGAVALILLPTDQLRAGNALMNIALGIASTLGLALGGIVVSGSSVATALCLNAVSFLAVALVVRSPSLRGVEAEHLDPVWTRLAAGLSYIRRTDALRIGLSLEAAAIVLFTMAIPVEVIYVRETLDGGSGTLGVLMAAWSGGILVGGLLFARLESVSMPVLVLVSTAFVGIGDLTMGLTQAAGIAYLAAAIGGLGNGMQWVSVITFLQERTLPEMQTRFSAFVESMVSIMLGLGCAAGGILAALTSAATTLGIAGAAILALATATAVVRPSRVLQPV